MFRLVIVAALVLAGPVPAVADLFADCIQHKDLDRRIRGCSQLIGLRRGKEYSYAKAVAYKARGSAYHEKGQYDRAVADYTKAIQLNPIYANAYNGRAWAYLKLGEAKKALSDSNKALSLSPQYAPAFDIRGHILEALGQEDNAIADFRRALELDPSLEESKAALKRLGVEP